MVLDLGRDYYKLDGTALEALRAKVASGDMEEVLKVYEKELQVCESSHRFDIPLTSLVTGQERADGESDPHSPHSGAKDKGKLTDPSSLSDVIADFQTDLSLSLLSLDHLLRSQQLTFAFVGLAPSLLVLYGLGGWMRGLWRGEKRGKSRRRTYFNGLR
jgi:nuclear-control-of-ATPase protein 2